MHLKLSEILDSWLLRMILETWSPERKKDLRKVTETISALTAEVDQTGEPEPGLYLVETTEGLQFLPVIAAVKGLCLTNDGRGFPQGRAHYVLAIIQLVSESDEKGENQSGPAKDQG